MRAAREFLWRRSEISSGWFQTLARRAEPVLVLQPSSTPSTQADRQPARHTTSRSGHQRPELADVIQRLKRIQALDQAVCLGYAQDRRHQITDLGTHCLGSQWV